MRFVARRASRLIHHFLSGGSDAIQTIIDFDLSSDVGDVAAQAIALFLQTRGELNIRGYVVDVTNNYTPGAIDAINTWYGYPDIPIGANKGSAFDPDGPGSFASYLAQNYTNDVLTAAGAAEGIAQFRQLLAAAADNSIVMLGLGPLNMLSLLLASTADGYSGLSGSSLVAAKVSKLIVMGGDWPNSGSPEWNFAQAAAAASDVIANWPTPIYLFGFTPGNTVAIGNGITSNTSASSPVRKAHELANVNTNGRAAWDTFPVLYAAKGLADDDYTYFAVTRGTAAVNSSTGANTWTDDAGGNHYYLRKQLTDYEYKTIFNKWLFWDPGEATPSVAAKIVYDDFTDTNGTSLDAHVIAPTNNPSATWTEAVGNWSISSNNADVAASAGGENLAYFEAGSADVIIECQFTFPASGIINTGMLANYQDATNYWLVSLYRSGATNSIELYRRVSGTYTKVAEKTSAGITYGATMTLRASFVGDNVQVLFKENGNSINYTVGSRPLKTATKCGIRISRKTPSDGGTDAGTVINYLRVGAVV